MQLNKPGAEIYIPDGASLETALARTTVMAISAHQDDIELMAYDGILKCFGKQDSWFTGVVVTDGRGSPRDGLYAAYSDDQMQQIRKLEQKKAAFVGEYSAQFLLNYGSSEVKDPANTTVIAEFKELILQARPRVIYTHNLADKHDTHVATAVKVVKAVRELSEDARPERLYGCEVWRDLDWLLDEEKVIFDVTEHENLAAAVMGVFDSQICGGKRYDLAIMGRRRANATFSASHGTDTAQALSYAMDLTPLIADPNMDIATYVLQSIERFAQQVKTKIKQFNP